MQNIHSLLSTDIKNTDIKVKEESEVDFPSYEPPECGGPGDIAYHSEHSEENYSPKNTNKRKYKFKVQRTLDCPQCKVIFEKRVELKQHIKTHHPSENLIFSCEQCKYKCRRLVNLENHMLNIHQIKDILCPHCGENCPDGKSYRKHVRSKHRKKEKRKKAAKIQSTMCSLCAKVFDLASSLSNHMRTAHVDEDNLWSCEHCGKKSNTKRHHNNHVLLHLPPNFSCTNCDQKFHTKSYLMKHIRNMHTEHSEKKFNCDECGKGFSNQAVLVGHMNMHSGLKPFRCR